MHQPQPVCFCPKATFATAPSKVAKLKTTKIVDMGKRILNLLGAAPQRAPWSPSSCTPISIPRFLTTRGQRKALSFALSAVSTACSGKSGIVLIHYVNSPPTGSNEGGGEEAGLSSLPSSKSTCKGYEGIIAEELPGDSWVLRCKGCRSIISPVNSGSQTAQHLVQATPVHEVMELDLTGEGSSHGSKCRAQQPLTNIFMLSSKQQHDFHTRCLPSKSPEPSGAAT
eukprot:scaffold59073_cov15-Tisochrysis_lutea.AAC.1